MPNVPTRGPAPDFAVVVVADEATVVVVEEEVAFVELSSPQAAAPRASRISEARTSEVRRGVFMGSLLV
jgi:hypothetical protein